MTDLTVTNAYSKGKAKTTLTINGNVEISNFKQGEAKPTAFVQAKVADNKVSVQSNKGNVQTLDLSNEKYSVMLKIANSSRDDSGSRELSWYDLRDTDKAKLGLDDSFVVKKDLKAGILNIYKKVGDKLTTWLHIDFETKTEKGNSKTDKKPNVDNNKREKLNPRNGKDIGSAEYNIHLPHGRVPDDCMATTPIYIRADHYYDSKGNLKYIFKEKVTSICDCGGAYDVIEVKNGKMTSIVHKDVYPTPMGPIGQGPYDSLEEYLVNNFQGFDKQKGSSLNTELRKMFGDY